jgi:hypothetical protein
VVNDEGMRRRRALEEVRQRAILLYEHGYPFGVPEGARRAIVIANDNESSADRRRTPPPEIADESLTRATGRTEKQHDAL